jgi:cell division protein FtsA
MRSSSRRAARRLVSVLDVGTAKVACLIAVADETGGMRVIGLGHQRSRGVKAGVIVDMDEAEQAIRASVGQAERMAGVTLEEVVVGVSCGRLASLNFAANTDVESGRVGDGDIARALKGARAFAERDGRALVHLNPTGIRLDGAPGGGDPRGMAARRLGLDLHAVTADEGPLQNLTLAVERCFLGVSALVPTPYASALAATTEEERRLGVAVLDIGAGTTTIAGFVDGRFVLADAIPVGGHHITFDIARSLQMPLAQAERIKALYGALVGAPSDAHDTFTYQLAGEEEGVEHTTTKAVLGEIMRPRVASLVDLAGDRLEHSGLGGLIGERVVVTGGSSAIVGLGELTASRLGRSVRTAAPTRLNGLPPSVAGPAFSTVVGLMLAATADDGAIGSHVYDESRQTGYLGRVGAWLRDGF